MSKDCCMMTCADCGQVYSGHHFACCPKCGSALLSDIAHIETNIRRVAKFKRTRKPKEAHHD